MVEGAAAPAAAEGGQPAAAAAPVEGAAAPAAAAPAAAPVEGSVAGNSPKWHESIPAGTFNERDMGVLTRFDSVDALAKGYMNAFTLVGRDKIPVPKTDAEWEETYDRLGRPKSHEEYELAPAEGLPDKLKENMGKNVGWFKQTAHELGLTKQQASKLYTKYSGLVMDANKTQTDQVNSEMSAAQDTLKTELGESYDGKMVLANRAISEIGGEGLISLFERTGMGRNPTVVKAFIRMGEMLGEETGLDKDGMSTDSQDTLDAQIAEIQANPAYMDAKAPEHKVLVDKMSKLMNRRHPEPPTDHGTIRLF